MKLEADIQNPPESSKPYIWWHWMNGNITKSGIKADLEGMKRVGIGGLQNFNVDLSKANTPLIVEKWLDYMSPESLKPTADLELASSVNRIFIHCSVHQPVDDKIPGLGLGWFGQWFTWHKTWAGPAKPWTTYLARSSYMPQQGKFVADVLYFYGEDKNIVALFRN